MAKRVSDTRRARRGEGGRTPPEPMDEALFRDLILKTFASSRWTQDTPIVPDLWLAYMRGADEIARARIAGTATAGDRPDRPLVSVLISPWEGASAGAIAAAIRLRLAYSERLSPLLGAARIATTTSRVVADLDLRGLVRAVVPLTEWWRLFTARFQPVRPDPTHREGERVVEAAANHPAPSEGQEKPEPAKIDVAIDAAAELEIGDEPASDGPFERSNRRTVNQARELDGFVLQSRRRDTDRKAPDGKATVPGSLRICEMFDDLMDKPEDGITATIREFLRFVVLVGFVERLSVCATVADYEATRVDALVLIRPKTKADREIECAERRRAFATFRDAYAAVVPVVSPFARPGPRLERRIWMVNPNRQAHHTVIESRRTAKLDAAERLFEVSGKGITFAVIDTGIDACHPGFRRDRPGDPPLPEGAAPGDPEVTKEELRRSRVVRTYDFTQLRDITIDGAQDQTRFRTAMSHWSIDVYAMFLGRLTTRAVTARNIDWELIEPAIRLEGEHWLPPTSPHGTHVAGILGADLPPGDVFDAPLRGMCPDIEIWDLRVFDPDTGAADEFTITCALDFVRWVNRGRDRLVIHGVNLSLALLHEVASFACGQTPICETCNRLVAEGVVVAAAAGNAGWDATDRQAGLGRGYNTVSITDPGNAASVITVGSTHRQNPHAYGVSYFSSRGPTGDGRRKPDLLAPGEKIWSLMPGGRIDRLDGTSMASPHVAGAAALLMARYPELIGRPDEIKRILMATATDLGREPHFQGAGLVDALRALQAV